MASLELPEDFAWRTIEMRGEAGRDWLARVPRLRDEAARRWSLTLGPAPSGLSYGYVCGAVDAYGVQVALKICFPDRELLTEVEALRVFDGHGVVRLLDADLDQGALLLERLEPGTPLSHVADDEEAISIAVKVMQQLWRPAPAGGDFPSDADWAAGLCRLRARFDGGTGPLPRTLVEEAERLFNELLADQGEQVLLHGDLHQDNILAAERAHAAPRERRLPSGSVAVAAASLFVHVVRTLPRPPRICRP